MEDNGAAMEVVRGVVVTMLRRAAAVLARRRNIICLVFYIVVVVLNLWMCSLSLSLSFSLEGDCGDHGENIIDRE